MTSPSEGDSKAVAALQRHVRGDVLAPGESGYEEARTLWNARVDRRPTAIVRAADADDVAAAVRVARERAHPVSVKAGGHHVSGRALADGAVTIDLSRLDGVEVDPQTRRVSVGAGARWGAVDAATEAHGLAVPGGQDPNIGVAGLTLGGGVGWLSRQHGLACDNLVAAEVVTADGDTVGTSAINNPDLFWALQGGGGVGFGVVTALHLRAHPIRGNVYAGALIADAERYPELVGIYRHFIERAPRSVRVLCGSMTLPPAKVFPERLHNARVSALIACHVGEAEEGERLLAPLREQVQPVADTLRPRAYTHFQRAGSSQWAARTHLRSHYVATPTDGVGDLLGRHIDAAPSGGATVFLSPRTGAETDPAPTATACPHREPAHHVLVEARWNDAGADEAHTEWVERAHAELEPQTTGAVEANFLAADEPAYRVAAAHGANRHRLAAIRDTWDPERVFGEVRFGLDENG
jgi:FAD/FMN-containing dehydrogenase